ncbi:type II CAAX prenyl endopeptidase Rce1 family protein [Luteococcus sp. OSA5]|uniref:CPBP family intramembrane glutamic endopeptidase n=1 Tax=Luteococcus sp. OSA5 TaxID=3401630 RepID=UPI003B434451
MIVASPSQPSTPTRLPGPTWRDVLAAFVLGMVVPVGALIGGLLLARAFGVARQLLPFAVAAAVLVMTVGLYWVVRSRLRWGWRELGFTPAARSLWHLCWELPVMVLGSALFAATVGPLVGLAPTSDADRASGSSLNGLGDRPLLLAFTVLALVVIGPLVEEVLFRRFLLDAIRARCGTWLAVLGSGVVFALVHVSPQVICYVLPLGFALGLLRVWHQTLWASLLAHCANNALVTAITLTLVL